MLSLLIAAVGCSKKVADKSLAERNPSPKITAQAAPQTVEEKPETPQYLYPYAKKRDPFVPLIGNGQAFAEAEAEQQPKGTKEENELAKLELKGIMRYKDGKVAIISSTDGESYTLRSGRIYDQKNKKINGITGIIKERSIVLISNNNTIKELTLQPDQIKAVRR